MTAIANSFHRAAQIGGARLAHTEGDITRSWTATHDRVLGIAAGLVRLGSRRLAILAANGIDYFELSYALLLAGIEIVPLNTRLAPPEIMEQLADCAADTLAVDPGFADFAARACEALPALRRVIGMDGAAAGTNLEVLAATTDRPSLAAHDPRECAAILYTGGTTGRPKGVMLSHANLDHDLACILADIGWPRGVRYLHVSPMFHLADLGPCWATTALLGSHVWLRRFSTEAMLDALEAHACTATALVPSMIAMMLESLGQRPRELGALAHIGYGAAAIGRPLLERLRTGFPQIALVQFYGQTEAGGSFCCLRAEDHQPDLRLASAGRAHASCHVRILGPDAAEVPRGTVGEITGRSAGVFMGYLGNPEATAAALHGGWLHTGDAGFMDDDGFVHVTDRLKDMVVTGGENVASSEVESVLMRHPAVAMAAVIGRTDSRWGEAVHAIIVPAAGQVPDAAALLAHCREAIASYKCPKSFEFRETLPLSAIGKVRKDLLRAELRELVPAHD